MSFLIKAKKVSQCDVCSGIGYVPLKGKKTSKTSKMAVEIGCSACESKGRITEDVELSLESLKDLLK